MKKFFILSSLLSIPTYAGVTIPAASTFSPGTTISSSQMNTNFSNIQSSFTELNGILPGTACSGGQSLSFNGSIMNCVASTDGTKLPLAGGTLSGPLNMGGNAINMAGATITSISTPGANDHAANKIYVDSAVATKLSLSGGTMTGILNMNSQKIQNLPTPVTGGDATNKTYVDSSVGALDVSKLAKSGGTMSGNIDMNSINFILNLPNPTQTGHAANKAYVDSMLSFTDCVAPNKCNINGEVRVGTATALGAKFVVQGQAPAMSDYRAVKADLATTGNSAANISAAEFTLNSAHDASSYHGLKVGVNHTLGNPSGGTTGITVKNSITGGTVGYNKGIFIDMFPASSAINNAGLHISTQGTEVAGDWAIRVDGKGKSFFGGRVGIKEINPAYDLHVNGSLNVTGCLYDNGVATTFSSCPSDLRLKRGIKSFELGLKLVENISPKSYEYNGLAETQAGIPQVGFIAQDLQKIAPELVKSEMKKLHPTDKTKTEIFKVDYSKFTFVLFNAVRELSSKVNGLEASRTIASEKDSEIAELKKENAMMKAYLCSKDKSAPFCH